MSKPTFVYVTYIATTPEKIWNVLTDANATPAFWGGVTVAFEQRVGAPLTMKRGDATMVNGEITVCDPPHRLAYTFHAEQPEVRHEQASRVSIEIESVPGQVKLTILHEGFAEDSKVIGMISQGWPRIMSSLKSLMETGKVLAPFAVADNQCSPQSASR
jgi:uncharacterized protein YndB with AHSA1/START domain